MLDYSYFPFKNNLERIGAEDLLRLKSVSEGWYIDYKSQGIKISDFAKHLSGFANQYGGWLFIGIEESSDGTRTASKFPGIPKSDLEKVSTDIREAAAAHVNPEILYEEHIVSGPIEEIGLASNYCILIIGIPMSLNTPHIHSSGRIYRRLADQSKPKEETDRFILDELWRRGAKHQKKITQFLKSLPDLPEAQSDTAWAHIYFRPAQHQVGPEKKLSFKEFSEIIKNEEGDALGVWSPMQALQTTANGYFARQIAGNDPSLATLSFRWWHDGRARLDIPLNSYDLKEFADMNGKHKYVEEFCGLARIQGYSKIKIVDYSLLTQTLASLSNLYLQVLNFTGDERDTYSCFTLRNVFFTSPYVDSELFMERARVNSIPITTDNVISVPSEPREENMFLHTFSSRNVDFTSQEKYQPIPYLYTAPIFYKIFYSVGVVSSQGEFTKDMEAWGFDKVDSYQK